jgi:hypothetical protein
LFPGHHRHQHENRQDPQDRGQVAGNIKIVFLQKFLWKFTNKNAAGSSDHKTNHSQMRVKTNSELEKSAAGQTR